MGAWTGESVFFDGWFVRERGGAGEIKYSRLKDDVTGLVRLPNCVRNGFFLRSSLRLPRGLFFFVLFGNSSSIFLPPSSSSMGLWR
jgi:hypothetical protein